jgi:hypothetical protein
MGFGNGRALGHTTVQIFKLWLGDTFTRLCINIETTETPETENTLELNFVSKEESLYKLDIQPRPKKYFRSHQDSL